MMAETKLKGCVLNGRGPKVSEPSEKWPGEKESERKRRMKMGLRFHWVWMLGLFFVVDSGAVDIQWQEIKVQGPGCDGIAVELDSASHDRSAIVMRMRHLKAELLGGPLRSDSQCQVEVPFLGDTGKVVKFNRPQLKGFADIAPHVEALSYVEMFWPGSRGPQLRTGYRPVNQRVTEEFQSAPLGIELTYGCGESSSLMALIGASLKGTSRYRRDSAELEVSEVRVEFAEAPCRRR